MARRRRKARANPRRRRVSRRRLRLNPAPKRKRARKARKAKKAAPARRRRLKKVAKRLSKRARVIRKRAKGMKRGLRKSTALTQAKRLSTLSRVARRGGKISRSPAYKAMHIKTNPGFAGLIVAAKTLAPQAAVGGVAMFGLAFGGKMLAAQIRKLPVPVAIDKYVPAISTVLLTGVGYVAADKVAPKYKGAVAIGGLMGAIVQAVVASIPEGATGFLADAKTALLGDYTTVGGRSYADGGIFREIGDYTTVGLLPEARDGGAYSNQRPRRGERDNSTEWSVDGYPSEAHQGGAYSTHRPRPGSDNATEWAVNGMDDTTEFAAGEGGVLSGGMFRGPSSR